jgi:Ca-activated chloride channel family protein
MAADDDLAPLLPDAPVPSHDGRMRALDAALRRFDEKNAAGRQGSAAAARLMERTQDHVRPVRRPLMTRTRYAAAASVALLIFGSAAALMTWDGIGRRPAPVRDQIAMVEPVQPPAPPPVVSKEAPPQSPPPGPVGESALPQPPPPASIDQARDYARQMEQSAQAMPSAGIAASRAQSYSQAARMAAPAMGVAMQKQGADRIRPPREPVGRDRFDGKPENAFRITREDPVSTFSIDVDTASYSFVRASLNRNVLPQPAAVRTEELVNYFPYAYPEPDSAAAPFKASVSVYPSPWAPERKLLHIGIKGYELHPAERPRANLVFLIDTSGSMEAPNRLPLVQQSLAMLVERLEPKDSVAIVTYAGAAGTVLEPTPVADKGKILAAIERLSAGGSTAGAEGIRQAYALAKQSFDKAGVNRIILATDGDFNVGITDQGELKGFVERQRDSGVYLSILGFGMGNYNDALMQALAQNGNGTAAYIDTLNEARKVLVDEASSTIVPIAKDVKIQVEFNPATVAEYRLIGYETRLLRREDFNNDKVDAGEVGSGHAVTALYEIVPAGGPRTSDDLRYAAPAAGAPAAGQGGEYAFLKLRYKLPGRDASELTTVPIGPDAAVTRFEDAPQEARFATAVAAFGELLRGGRDTGKFGYDDVLRIASAAKGDDAFGYRAEFLQLVRAAKTAAALPATRR